MAVGCEKYVTRVSNYPLLVEKHTVTKISIGGYVMLNNLK